MWCDNCLLLLPLRAGASVWAAIIALYSFGGAYFLLRYGEYIYFVYPEWLIYGGIAILVGATAVANIFALSNQSYILARVCKGLWPFNLVVCGVRAILMIWELNRGQSNIDWECQNGQQLWPASAAAGYGGTPVGSFPPGGICTQGFASLYTAVIVGLLVDMGFQIYMLFLNWRFTVRLENYASLKNSSLDEGLYTA